MTYPLLLPAKKEKKKHFKCYSCVGTLHANLNKTRKRTTKIDVKVRACILNKLHFTRPKELYITQKGFLHCSRKKG